MVQVTTLQFVNKISEKEITYLRGVAISATQRKSVLFHNHIDEELRYSYPLVQYKRLSGKAAIVFVGDACQQIPLFMNNLQNEVNLGTRPVKLLVESMHTSESSLLISEEGHRYSFSDWIPFNQENFHKFNQLVTLSEKIAMLESLLVGNILSMAKGLGVFFEDTIVVKLADLSSPMNVQFKGNIMKAYNGSFITNIDLPSNIGLGKGSSIGFGTITEE